MAQNLPEIATFLTVFQINDTFDFRQIQDDLLNSENLKVAMVQLCNDLQVCNLTML